MITVWNKPANPIQSKSNHEHVRIVFVVVLVAAVVAAAIDGKPSHMFRESIYLSRSSRLSLSLYVCVCMCVQLRFPNSSLFSQNNQSIDRLCVSVSLCVSVCLCLSFVRHPLHSHLVPLKMTGSNLTNAVCSVHCHEPTHANMNTEVCLKTR